MFIGKMFRVFAAQINKIANWFWQRDPIAIMQYEVDRATEQLKEGRQGFEQYAGLVETVKRQVAGNQRHVNDLTAKIRARLQAGLRAEAATLALELEKAKAELATNEEQLKQHQVAYNNNLLKMKNASKKIAAAQQRVREKSAELKMSAAEAEIAQLSTKFNFDVSTDFGQIETMIDQQIDTNRGKVRVAVDMSGEGIEAIKQDQAAEAAMAENALRQFEVAEGLVTPETAMTDASSKEVGPAVTQTT